MGYGRRRLRPRLTGVDAVEEEGNRRVRLEEKAFIRPSPFGPGRGATGSAACRASRVLEAAVTEMPLDVAGFFGQWVLPFGRTDFGGRCRDVGLGFVWASGRRRVHGPCGLAEGLRFEPNGHHWLVDDTRSNNFAHHCPFAAHEKTSYFTSFANLV